MRTLTALALAALLALSTGCRPQACIDLEPHLAKVDEDLQATRYEAAITGLLEIERVVADEAGYLSGFGEKSAGLREALERHARIGSLEPEEQDVQRSRLPVLLEGWKREAGAVARRCRTSYLL